MEIKDRLRKPYTEQDRIQFIIKNNHRKGYKIAKVTDCLLAFGYTDEELEELEKERIGNLQITKRVFALALQQMGITYSQLKELIATNEQAQMEWDLCVELQRKNPLLDIMGSQMGISSEQIDYIFRKANGEDVPEPVQEIPMEEPEINEEESTEINSEEVE